MTVTEADLPAMVDALRERIGAQYEMTQVNRVITSDVIGRYALGIGDDNPLFVDPEYASGTPFGRVIAPPTFLATAVRSRPQGLRGVHALFAGMTIDFERPVVAGERLTSLTALDSLVEKQGKYSGDELTPILKGPLSVADVICWLNGVGTGVFIKSSRQWYEYLERHPAAGMPDEYGVPDAPECVHWDEKIAAKIGMPGPYDYGWQRCAWLGHVVTDWIGDQAWIKRIELQLRAPNYVGDLTTVTGSVVSVDPVDGSLTIEMQATDHRGRLTAKGSAVVTTAIPDLGDRGV